MTRYDYEIGEKTYCQVELGSARAALVMPFVLESMMVGGDPRQIISGLLRHAATIMPIVLLDEGMSESQWLRENKDPKWLENRTFYFSTLHEYTQALEVLQDFLACNPIGLWLDRAAGVLTQFTGILSTPDQNLSGSAPSVPVGTPTAETPS